ncbi:MAG: DNA translocase FtsK [Gemmatimonadetes bacterium]|nr:DNA translocase FtsK [Gemmatimonadota bacterium]
MLSREQQREILAIGLIALALFALLSLVPVTILGSRGFEWFPGGNFMGLVGGAVSGLLRAFLGEAAYIVPPLLVVGGLRAGGWLNPEYFVRLGILGLGLLIVLPTAIWVILPDREVFAGWLGMHLGHPLVELVSPLGAILLALLALVALSVGTLGWNPLSTIGRGVAAGGGLAGRTAKGVAAKVQARAAARAEMAAKAAAALPAEVLEETPLVEEVEEPASVEGSAVEESDDAEQPASARNGRKKRAIHRDGPYEPEPPVPDTLPDGSDQEVAHESVPPMDLLTPPDERDRSGMERELDELGRILVEKLKTFNVDCTLGGRTTGPMVTQFEVVPAPGVKVNRIANLDADLALAMKAASVRIVAPIPGKGAVGVEIPNPQPEIVNLREILQTPQFQGAKGELPLALGKDLNGRPYVANLAKMPHVLIAGATGSGKSVCLNTIITSLVYKHTPETLRLLMIDPKMVELSVYTKLPHLRHNVVTDPRDAAGLLKWAVLEMGRRYELLKANHVRSIQEFNRKVKDGMVVRRVEPSGPQGDEDRWIYSDGVLPYVVVVVDELADLMMTVQSEVEKPLTQLAQKARAIGIHLIVATQRPSVNVITGLIKANFPTRIAFRVASKTDSRTILDQNGADALLGNGDMLFLPPGEAEPVRIQGAYLPTEDTEQLMAWYRELQRMRDEEDRTATPDSVLEPDILEELRTQELMDAATAAEEITGDWDELFYRAAEVCIQNGGGSTSLLQRKLSIGYGRAARIVDQLEDAGVLGPSDGAKGREVLMSLDELDAFLGGGG